NASPILKHSQYFILYCGVRWIHLAHNIPYFRIVFLKINKALKAVTIRYIII
uniref:Uncharacterized protein n=1 Tax=Ciona intestinalis TaxID=7719 RepID=H2Y3H6_CIOIN